MGVVGWRAEHGLQIPWDDPSLVARALAPDDLGLEAWPPTVPVQVHVSVDDPWFGRDDARPAVAGIPTHLLDLHEHPGGRHLFADTDWHDHDPAATATMLDAITGWLSAR